MEKYTAILVSLLMIAGPVTGQAQEKMGVSQDVNIMIDRGDYGPVQRTTLYCMNNSISYCSEDTSVVDTISVMLNMTDMYQGFLDFLPWTNTEESNDRNVRTLG